MPPEENYSPVRVGPWASVKVRVSFRVGEQPDNSPGGKLPPWLRLGFRLGLVLRLGDNFPRGQLSYNPVYQTIIATMWWFLLRMFLVQTAQDST